jgi:hypothetical protein
MINVAGAPGFDVFGNAFNCQAGKTIDWPWSECGELLGSKGNAASDGEEAFGESGELENGKDEEIRGCGEKWNSKLMMWGRRKG